MILKVIYRLQAFSNAIRRTFVQHFTRFQLTVCSHGSSALADLLVLEIQMYLHILPCAPGMLALQNIVLVAFVCVCLCVSVRRTRSSAIAETARDADVGAHSLSL